MAAPGSVQVHLERFERAGNQARVCLEGFSAAARAFDWPAANAYRQEYLAWAEAQTDLYLASCHALQEELCQGRR